MNDLARKMIKKGKSLKIGESYRGNNKDCKESLTKALNECHEISKKNGNSNMSLAEINAEIQASRREIQCDR